VKGRTSFLFRADRYYLNYSLENERTDNGLLLHGSQGPWSRREDALSEHFHVYVEERNQNGASLTAYSYTGTTSREERWNFGGSGSSASYATSKRRRDDREARYPHGLRPNTMQFSSGSSIAG